MLDKDKMELKDKMRGMLKDFPYDVDTNTYTVEATLPTNIAPIWFSDCDKPVHPIAMQKLLNKNELLRIK